MQLIQASVVVAGSGFTPENFGPAALTGVVGVEPSQAVSTPVAAVLDYPNRYHLLVTGNRLEVRLDAPDTPDDPLLAAIVARCLELWPLVAPTALGVNFVLGQAYNEGFTARGALAKFLRLGDVEQALGTAVIDSQHSVRFEANGCKVLAKISSEVPLPEGTGIGVDWNVHRDAPENVATLLGERGAWFARCRDWSDRLVGFHKH